MGNQLINTSYCSWKREVGGGGRGGGARGGGVRFDCRHRLTSFANGVVLLAFSPCGLPNYDSIDSVSLSSIIDVCVVICHVAVKVSAIGHNLKWFVLRWMLGTERRFLAL